MRAILEERLGNHPENTQLNKLIRMPEANFDINFLDHVALNVADMEASVNWYSKVLGLKKYKLPKWGEYPIFMMSGKSGVALFPAKETKAKSSKNEIRIDHFTFNVTNENFQKARSRYQELRLKFEIKDHYYFHSIYTRDPDDHIVELTTLVVEETEFYGKFNY